MTSFLGLLAGFGIGSVITVLFQWVLARWDSGRSLRYQERKDAYLGLWEALHRSDVEGTEAAAFNVGHWAVRCELVAPAEVR